MDKNRHKFYMAQILSLIFKDRVAWCAEHVKVASPKFLMQGLGEVLDDTKTKTLVRTRLIAETASALELFSAFPLIARQI